MNYLLDTHILLWSLREPDRLSQSTRELLDDPNNDLWLSPISLWECLILARKGRIVLRPDPVEWTKNVVRDYPFREAPLNHEVVIQSQSVSLSHEDPADRFLAGTAVVYDLALITADDRLIGGQGYRVRPN